MSFTLQRRLLVRKTHHSIITLPPFIYWLCVECFRGSEARQTRQVAVSLLSWQFPVLRNHSLSIEHYQKRLIRSRPACGLFGVLIRGYDLTRTLSNLVSRAAVLCLIGSNTFTRMVHVPNMFIQATECSSLSTILMFRLVDGCCQRRSQRAVSCKWLLMLLESCRRQGMSLSGKWVFL